MAVADQTANAVSILLGVGGGHFAPRIDLTTGNGPVALATADFNGNNRPDLASANEAANTVSVILNSNVFRGLAACRKRRFRAPNMWTWA